MTNIKIFSIRGEKPEEIKRKHLELEKEMQKIIEHNMDEFFGIKFLASEFSTGKKHKGRVDSLGIDENYFPVIIEYKKQKHENIINQGLFYLDWLSDHHGDFEILVQKQIGNKDKYGKKIEIDWTSPRLLCIAEDFTKYDSYAVEQMNRNIELIKCQMYHNDLILFELVNAVEGETQPQPSRSYKGFKEYLIEATEEIKGLFQGIDEYILSLGDDIQKKELKYYVAYKKLSNFTCVELKKDKILLFLKIDPASLSEIPEFARDVTDKGHYGTGNLEVTVKTVEDLEMVKPFIEKSYMEN